MPNTQTKHKPKCILLFCKEWEIQCECVGKAGESLLCGKDNREKKQRDNQRLWRRPNRASIHSI